MASSNTPDISITKAVFHRNGSGGQSFYRVDFVNHYENGEDDHLIAIIPTDATNEQAGDIECYVIDPLFVGAKWRGDVLGDVLIPALRAWNEAEDARVGAY